MARGLVALTIVAIAASVASCGSSAQPVSVAANVSSEAASAPASSPRSTAAPERVQQTAAPSMARETVPAATVVPAAEPPHAAAAPLRPTSVPTIGEAVRTKAVEVRIEGVETAAQIGGRTARPGYEFVIVDTVWKNIIPLRPVQKKPRDSTALGGFGGLGAGGRSSSSIQTTLRSSRRRTWFLRRSGTSGCSATI
jgi:hypothetical protein